MLRMAAYPEGDQVPGDADGPEPAGG
jgi:hypothetical protein